MGGYHAPAIQDDTQTLFEEVLCLGVAADMVMSLCQEAQEPVPNFRVATPNGTVPNNRKIFSCRPKTTRNSSKTSRPRNNTKSVRDTRFNLRYIKSISDITGNFNTFRNEKMCFPRMAASGGETQIIVTRPTPGEDQHEAWTTRSVQATSAADSSTAVMGGSFMFGFQSYKEPGEGRNNSE